MAPDSSQHSLTKETENSWLGSLLKRWVKIHSNEVRPLVLSSVYFFFILLSYYLINPLRSGYGYTKLAQSYLPWLFTITMVLILGLNPIYGALISRFSRARFMPWVFYFFLGSFILFFLALMFLQKPAKDYVSLAFFVWASVFNVFIVSVFWDFLVDIFDSDQAKRFFVFIGVVGNIGALIGSTLVESLSRLLKPEYLILLSALILFLATRCGNRLHILSANMKLPRSVNPDSETPPGAGSFSFVKTVFRSPYLLSICAYTLILIMSGTFLFVRHQQLADVQGLPKEDVIRSFARVNFLTGLLVIVIQIFLARRVLSMLSVTKRLMIMPLLIILGLGLVYLFPETRTFFFSYSPQLLFVMVLQSFSKALEYSIAKPARKVLFTILSRDEKYSAQSFIDTFVHRGADTLLIWTQELLSKSKIDPIFLGWGFLPIWLVWLYLSYYLGSRYQKRSLVSEKTTQPQ